MKRDERSNEMQDRRSHSNGSRGSSPPFQKLERWLDDGVNGAHWVRAVQTVPRRPEYYMEQIREGQSAVLVQADDECRWEDDGGGGTQPA